MNVFKVKYVYGPILSMDKLVAEYGDVGLDHWATNYPYPLSNETNVVADSLPEAISKVYVEIVYEENRRQRAIIDRCTAEGLPIPEPKTVFVTQLNIQQEFIKVIS